MLTPSITFLQMCQVTWSYDVWIYHTRLSDMQICHLTKDVMGMCVQLSWWWGSDKYMIMFADWCTFCQAQFWTFDSFQASYELFDCLVQSSKCSRQSIKDVRGNFLKQQTHHDYPSLLIWAAVPCRKISSFPVLLCLTWSMGRMILNPAYF